MENTGDIQNYLGLLRSDGKWILSQFWPIASPPPDTHKNAVETGCGSRFGKKPNTDLYELD